MHTVYYQNLSANLSEPRAEVRGPTPNQKSPWSTLGLITILTA